MSYDQHYDETAGSMPIGPGQGMLDLTAPMEQARLDRLARAAAQAAHRGNVARADLAELEAIRTKFSGFTSLDGEEVSGQPVRLVRGFGQAGVLAVEWLTVDGVRYTDIEAKEIEP